MWYLPSPFAEILFYQQEDGSVPLLRWLEGLPLEVQYRCLVRLERLEKRGRALEGPETRHLRDDIHCLCVRAGDALYGMPYFFLADRVAVVSHGFAGDASKFLCREAARAIQHRSQVMRQPHQHLFRPEP